MKKVIKLTESDLTNIVKRAIEENEIIKEDINLMDGIDNFLKNFM